MDTEIDPDINKYFGLETMKKLYRSYIKRDNDFVVVVVHWLLSKHGFKCIGKGDGREIAGDEQQSELLPDHWNDESIYLLRYMYTNSLYLLRITKATDDIIVNLIKAQDMKVLCILINGLNVTDEGLQDEINYIDKIQKELVFPFIKKSNKYKTGDGKIEQPKRIENEVHVVVNRRVGLRELDPVGRRDLDPFAFGPDTGMLYNGPQRPDHPLVRFDPITPENGPLRLPRRRNDPDSWFPEHLY